MNLTKIPLICLFISTTYLLQATESKIKLPKVIDMPEAIVPMPLQNQRYKDPKAEVRVSISKEGVPLEAMCKSADHYLLAETAVKVVMDTNFTRGKSNGEPIQSLSTITIPFKYQSDYLSTKSSFDHMSDFAGTSNTKNEDKIVHCKAQELDEALRIITPPKLIMVKDENNVPQTGSATIEGMVDTEGRFCLLNVIKSDNDHVALAAIDSFSQVVFNQPRKEGARATTRIRLPYKASMPAEAK